MSHINIPSAVTVCTVSTLTNDLKGPALVRSQKSIARSILKQEMERAGIIPPEVMPQEASGKPLPFKGIHWSISHKPQCVAAMIAPAHCGVDIEVVSPRKKELLEYVAPFNEWEMAGFKKDQLLQPGPDVWHFFYRFWTAREALLKCIGVGLALLSKCRVIEIPSSDTILMELDKKEAFNLGFPAYWTIFQKSFHDSSCKKDIIVSWTSVSGGPESKYDIKIEKNFFSNI
jgi:4'-phosphopantetheinyl transferase